MIPGAGCGCGVWDRSACQYGIKGEETSGVGKPDLYGM